MFFFLAHLSRVPRTVIGPARLLHMWDDCFESPRNFYNDQAFNCPRHQHLSPPWGPLKLTYIISVWYRGVGGYPIGPHDAERHDLVCRSRRKVAAPVTNRVRTCSCQCHVFLQLTFAVREPDVSRYNGGPIKGLPQCDSAVMHGRFQEVSSIRPIWLPREASVSDSSTSDRWCFPSLGLGHDIQLIYLFLI